MKISRCNATLLAIRTSYFTFFFSLACLLPFLPVFLKEIGLDAEQAGIINGARPMVQFLFLPCWGFIADKTQRYRTVLTVVIVISTIITFSAPWIADGINDGKLCSENITAVNASRTNSTSSTSTDSCQSSDLLFYIMLLVFCGGACFDGSIPSFIDTAAVERIRRLKDRHVNFGALRLFGSVGFGIASFATGVGVQLAKGESADYFVAFYLFLAAKVALLLVSIHLFSGIEKSETRPKVLRPVLRQLMRLDVVFFLSTIVVMGLANGALYGFMFWFISDLGGSEILMGISVLVSSVSELVIFPFSSQLISIVGGNMAAICIGLFSYGIRFLAMSYVVNPWMIVPLQLFHSFGFALFWSAAIYQITRYSTDSTQATMVSILNALHFGIGTGLAGIVGGVFYKKHGGRQVFRFSSGVCFVWSAFVAIVILWPLKRSKTETEDDEEHGKATTIQMKCVDEKQQPNKHMLWQRQHCF